MRRIFLLTSILRCFLILSVSSLSIFALKVFFEEQTELKWTTNYKINKLSFNVAWEKACDVATADWLNLNTRNVPVNNDVSRGCIFPLLVGARSALVNICRKALLSSVGFRKRMTSRSPRGSPCDSCKLRFDLPLWFVWWSDVCFEVLSCFFDHPSIDSTKKMPLHLFGKDVF